MNHLTDEQLAAWLAGEADQQARSHFESCPQCHDEALELRDGISRYSVSMRRQAGQAQRTHLNGYVVPWKALLLHRLRWAGAGVLAILLTAQTLWLMKPRYAPSDAEPANAAVSSQPASHSQSASPSASPSGSSYGSPLSDDELLEAVNNDLSREVPMALAPVSAITTARNRIAAASSLSTTTGNDSTKKKNTVNNRQGEAR